MIITQDIRKWAKEYEGEKFHSILADPPYALVSITKRFGRTSLGDDTYTSDKVRNGSDSYSRLIATGFMGQAWDNEVAFDPELWYDLGQHLYPGAYLLAFGGTRTFHRLACAIEDAGFEIRDTMMWLYGCLSEDTEILTVNGWEHYHKNITINPVLCYNIDDDSFEFHKPTKSYSYANKHTAYHIQSDNTDQIVSRNHRCLIERSGRKVFVYAEELEDQENIPFLESLRDLPETISYPQFGASIKKQDLLERVYSSDSCCTATSNTQADRAKKNNTNLLCGLWKRKVDSKFLAKEDKSPNLLKKMQRCFARTGVEETRLQGPSELETRKRASTQRKNDWREKLGVEGRGNILQNAWELCGRKIRALSERVFGYGAQRWLCYGTSPDSGAISREIPLGVGMRPSYQSRCNRQPIRESNAIQDKSGAQNIRRTRATITPIEYSGNVWCVEVPTGVFVARRNGKIFITGNSGFPKSHNIGRAIDKQAGAKREVVGIQKHPTSDDRTGDKSPYQAENSHLNGEFEITAPATDMAKIWDGYGTALKPAFEPIIVARKPVEGTIANNCVTYGSGALNIDGCRVEGEPWAWGTQTDIRGGGYDNKRPPDGDVYARNVESNPKGRWPANLITDGSEEVLEGFPNSNGSKPIRRKEGFRRFNGTDYSGGKEYTTPAYESPGYADSGSAARFFYCAKVSPAERNAGLEKNSHPTLKPIALTEYLARLI